VDQEAARSRLTRSGKAVEYAFVWPEGSPRFTADPSPGATAAARLATAVSLTGFELCPRLREVAGWQSEEARWGAWVGARCRDGLPSYKLYLEVPEGAPWLSFDRELCEADPFLDANNATLCMVGFAPSETVETYYRLRKLYRDQVPLLLERVGLPDESRELISMVQRLIGRTIHAEFPSANLGYSYSVSPRGVQAFTLYSHASSFLGHDSAIRSEVLRYAEDRGWDVSAYRDLTASLLESRPQWSRHGMVGFVLDSGGGLHLTIGVTEGEAA
jgi:hypothetical protein